jgi:hypothetical protein
MKANNVTSADGIITQKRLMKLSPLSLITRINTIKFTMKAASKIIASLRKPKYTGTKAKKPPIKLRTLNTIITMIAILFRCSLSHFNYMSLVAIVFK